MASYSKPNESSTSGTSSDLAGGLSSTGESTSTHEPAASSEGTQPRQSSGVRESMRDVRRDAGMIREDVASLGSNAKAAGINAYHEATDQISEYARSFGESAKQYHSAACDKIAQRPTTAILIAAGAGILLGRYLGRK